MIDPRRPAAAPFTSCEVYCPRCAWVMNGPDAFMAKLTADQARDFLAGHVATAHPEVAGCRGVEPDCGEEAGCCGVRVDCSGFCRCDAGAGDE